MGMAWYRGWTLALVVVAALVFAGLRLAEIVAERHAPRDLPVAVEYPSAVASSYAE